MKTRRRDLVRGEWYNINDVEFLTVNWYIKLDKVLTDRIYFTERIEFLKKPEHVVQKDYISGMYEKKLTAVTSLEIKTLLQQELSRKFGI